MSLLFYDDFETGDLSLWDNSVGGTINGDAALEGSLGLEIIAGESDSADTALTLTVSNDAMRLGFLLDINDFTLTGGPHGIILIQNDPSGQPFDIALTDDGAEIDLVFTHYDDATTQHNITYDGLTAGMAQWEMRIVRASSDVASDGEFHVYRNSVAVGSVTGLDNYDIFGGMATCDLYINMFGGEGDSGSFYFDALSLRDDDVAIFFSGYDVVRSSGGLMKNALAVSADGDALFLAVEDDASGNQIIFKITRPPGPTVSIVYNPGSGSAANVYPTTDFDRMVFAGNFGTDLGVIDHRIAVGTNTDISPASAGADVISPLAVDPADPDHIIAINKNDEDAIETVDNGANWTTLNAALGIQVVGMGLLFFGNYWPVAGYVGGNDGVDENASFTPNEFGNLRDDAPAALKSAGAITGIDVAIEYE